MVAFSLLILLGVVVILWRMLKRQTNGPQPPTYPGALPIIGHGHLLLGNKIAYWKLLKDVSDFSLKMGGVVKAYPGPVVIYVLTDPDDALTVTNACLDKHFVYDFSKSWITYGLVTSDGASWKKNRKLLSPAFRSSILNQHLGSFNRQSRRLVDRLTSKVGKGKFDPKSHIFSNLMETVSEAVLGLKPEDSKLVNEDYAHAVDTLLDGLSDRLKQVWLQWQFFYDRSNLKKRQDKVINKAKETTMAVVRKQKSKLFNYNKQSPNNISDENKTVLDFILENYIDDEGFTDDIIRDHMDTFMIASFDTTGTALLFALKLIGDHPDVQNKIFNEIRHVFEGSDRDVDKADLSKLTYLEAVIKETVRLYPPVPYIARTVHTDIKLKNYTLPRGCGVTVSLYGINRHPAWGEDADQFRPERWLDTTRPRPVFAGFSIGKRSCIGEDFAMKLIKTNLVHIIRRYRISADDCELVIKYNAFIRPVSGHHISLEMRC